VRSRLVSVLRLIGLLMLMQVLPLLVLLLSGMGKSLAAQALAALLFTVAAVAMCRLCLQIYRKQADGYFQDWQSRFSGKKLLWAAGYIALMLATNPLYEMLMAALGMESSVDNLRNQRMVMEMLQRAPLTMTAYIVLFAPVLEELLLRGIFFQSFGSIENRGKRWLLLGLSALVFCRPRSPPKKRFVRGGAIPPVRRIASTFPYKTAPSATMFFAICHIMADTMASACLSPAFIQVMTSLRSLVPR